MFELSEKQRQILCHDGHLLVKGGPGSGKTTVSILKAERLVRDVLGPGQKVLFLSFARSTIARVIEALTEHGLNKSEAKGRVLVDTYHAFFWRLLRTHGYLLGLPRRLNILTPSARAVALSAIRYEFGPSKKLTLAQQEKRRQREAAELQRLAFEDGNISFDLFADLTKQILIGSTKIRQLVSSTYPVIILDEFQDTNASQWDVVKELGIESTLIALADEEQRIFDFIGADPERLDHFIARFNPGAVDLGNANHRSSGTDIARFGDEMLKGRISGTYLGIQVVQFPANLNRAMAALKGQTLQARRRLLATGNKNWSLAILVPTKQLMLEVSNALRTPQLKMPPINHHAAIDIEGAILASECIAFLLQPHRMKGDFETFVGLLCNFFRGKGGDNPSNADIMESFAIEKALDKALELARKGKAPTANSIILPIRNGYEQCVTLQQCGNPDKDWLALRGILANCGCKRLAQVAAEANSVRLLDRGTELREALSLEWRTNGAYTNGLEIVRKSFVKEHFATSTRRETGIIVMNMHKAKGKQFDEVIIFEGWPRMSGGQIIANLHRIVRGNIQGEHLAQAQFAFRVSVTRARIRTTIMTPEGNPCILLPAKSSYDSH